jgi:hypothetical protein
MATIPAIDPFRISMAALDESLIRAVMDSRGLSRVDAESVVNELVAEQTERTLIDLGLKR